MISLLLIGCRPIPGGHDYARQEDLGWLSPEEALEGADPWQPGELRLTVGAFYEGGASHAVPVDNLRVFYYIYEGTYDQAPTDERVEGVAADLIRHAGGPWMGGGVHFEDGARDFSEWSVLHLSVRSPDPAMASFSVGMVTASGEYRVALADYGFLADDAWHALVIPMNEVASDLDFTTAPLVLVGGPADAGASLLLDDLYWTPE